jgi:hypothetical protein
MSAPVFLIAIGEHVENDEWGARMWKKIEILSGLL